MKKPLIPYKWELVFWLFLAFFLNQADRQIFNVLLPDIRNGLGLTDADMGLVASVLTLVYGIIVPIGGLLGGKISKKYILVGALLLWSSATLLTGLASSLPILILLRSIATGGGEAFYSPAASALISENHPPQTRATALSVHQTALYVGFILSSVIATAISNQFGWRSAFYVFGSLGVILAVIIAFRVKKVSPPLEGGEKATEKPVAAGIGASLAAFFKCPSAWLFTLAFAGAQFAGTAFYTWMPTYLQSPDGFALDNTKAAFHATFYFQLASIVGVMVGARLADKYVAKNLRSRAFVLIAGLAVSCPFMYLMASSRNLVIVDLAMVCYGLFKGAYDSNLYASLYDVVKVQYRSAATSFILMFGFIVASAAPLLLGVLSGTRGLGYGLQLMSYIYLASAVPVVIAAIFTLKRDVAALHRA